MKPVSNPRAAAALTLAPLLNGKGSLSSLDDSAITPRDRGLYRALCYGVCRTLPRLEGLAGFLLSRGFKSRDQDVQGLLLVGLYQLLYMRVPSHAAVSETAGAARQLGKPWATRVLNACLRRCQREQEALLAKVDSKPAQRLLHPAWLLDNIYKAWPDQADDILAANNSEAPMTLRVNLAIQPRDAYFQTLAAQHDHHTGNANDTAEAHGEPVGMLCQDAPAAITLTQPTEAISLPGFETGEVSVQDESAQLAAPMLLAPLLATPQQQPLRVLDACSAPGGKSMHLMELAWANDQALELIALDNDAQRLERVEEGIERLAPPATIAHSIMAADASVRDWWDDEPFDAILLDAPCSGTGVIRRHPDIKTLRQPADIKKLAQLQGSILDNLWPLLKPGGHLLYATCSIMPQENEQQVAAFVKRQEDATSLPIQADWGIATEHGRQRLPQLGGSDGFFYALLNKRAD